MIIPVRVWPTAWLPLTPRGVAAFAGASLARLLAVQFVFALLTAGTVVWFLSVDWFPTVRAAIQQLPSRGKIQSGRLNWTGDAHQLLAEGKFIAFSVDPDHRGRVWSPADVQVEFGQENVRVISLFGYGEWTYSGNLNIALSRSELQPWWGAWEPPILWISLGASVLVLMAGWMLLATVYFWMVWLVGFFANRSLNLRASWKLAGAALMPGTLVIAAGIVGYGLGELDLVTLLALVGVHFVVGWFFLLISPFFTVGLPSSTRAKVDPFIVRPEDRAEGQKK